MKSQIKKIFFVNPPGPLYQRGEDRSQGNIEQSSATSLRAPNDLAYMAAVAGLMRVECRIKDYPPERGTWNDFKNDIKNFQPDMIVLSVTNATVLKDMTAFDLVKEMDSNVICIAKGAFFFSAPVHIMDRPECRNMDFAIYGEAETIIRDLIETINKGLSIELVDGIICRTENRLLKRNKPKTFIVNLDDIPFPARDLLNNRLYMRPDTGEPQATIQTARGCPHSCVFCLTPVISGKALRKRSVKNICDEIEDCVNCHQITNFFFKADTFTLNKNDVIELCQEIIKRELSVQWVANSRVDTVDEEMLGWMKRAGCWLVAYGIESGDPEGLIRMKKGATTEQARRAVHLAKSYGLQVYGFFIIGLPWDSERSIQTTFDFAAELECDFYEIHIAVPYEGTELYGIAESMDLLEMPVIGHDYFNDPVMKTVTLNRRELLRLRNQGLKRLYANPKHIFKTLGKIRSPNELLNYSRYGLRYLKNLVKSSV